MITASSYSHGQAGEGAAFLFVGGPTGLGALPYWQMEPDRRFANFGLWARGAGDVDADGYADWLVGAWDAPRGAAVLYFGPG